MQSFRWDCYKSHLSKGFANLQVNGEFVDMTLAADGYLVKVHRNIVSLASPYIKEMIKSAPSSHPVIFFNNMNHKILEYLLEYIYTGEVLIPDNKLQSFLETAKSLCIIGIKEMQSTNNLPVRQSSLQELPTNHTEEFETDIPLASQEPLPIARDIAAHITINGKNGKLEIVPLHYNKCTNEKDLFNDNNMQNVPVDSSNHVTTKKDNIRLVEVLSDRIQENQYSSECQETELPTLNVDESDLNLSEIHNSEPIPYNIAEDFSAGSESDVLKAKALSPLYSISNRGSLQLMLNRFIYYCHHISGLGRKRRWRCVDYRKSRCPAFIDTENEVIVVRRSCHTHAFHDGIIIKKFKRSKLYTMIKDAERAVAMAATRNNEADGDEEKPP